MDLDAAVYLLLGRRATVDWCTCQEETGSKGADTQLAFDVEVEYLD